MKKLFLILNLIISISLSEIIRVDINGNHDYITIQSGVDNAEIGDTVVVYPGTYYENIILDKSIVLASLAIFDNLNNWFEYSDFTNQYEVTNDNVNNTIIDGSTAEFNLGAFGSDDIKDYIGSCIFIASFNEQCISPSVIGFTIQNGLGSITQGPEWYGYRKLKGGGILSYKSNANINFNNFINNGNSYIQYGGAIYFEADTIEQYNYWEMGGCELSDINIQNNFYNGNDSKYANTFSSRNFNGNILIDKSVFDVLNCSDNSFTEAWFDIHSESEAVFSEIFSNKCSVINDLWISPSGNDSLNDGSIENPLKTINYALEIINPSVENNITIHLDEGIYSPLETGEIFSLVMQPNITLKGSGKELTILKGDNINSIISVNNCQNTSILDLSIVNGYPAMTDDSGSAGGIMVSNSGLNIINTNVSTNTYGGISAVSSNLNISYSIISRNTGGLFNSAGIDLINSIAHISSTTIVDNYSGWAARGINGDDNSYFSMINSIVWDNNIFEDLNNPWLINVGYGYGTEVDILYSIVKGGWTGEGNLGWDDDDPLFTDPYQGIDFDDFYISPFGDYSLQSNSSCIDNGIAYFELNGEIIIDLNESDYNGNSPDMGAFEFYEFMNGDINLDQDINVLDIVLLVEIILYDDMENDLADINGDNLVNILDVVMLVSIILN